MEAEAQAGAARNAAKRNAGTGALALDGCMPITTFVHKLAERGQRCHNQSPIIALPNIQPQSLPTVAPCMHPSLSAGVHCSPLLPPPSTPRPPNAASAPASLSHAPALLHEQVGGATSRWSITTSSL